MKDEVSKKLDILRFLCLIVLQAEKPQDVLFSTLALSQGAFQFALSLWRYYRHGQKKWSPLIVKAMQGRQLFLAVPINTYHYNNEN